MEYDGLIVWSFYMGDFHISGGGGGLFDDNEFVRKFVLGFVYETH